VIKLGLFRNKEVKIFLIVILLIGALGTIACTFISAIAAFITGATSLLTIFTYLFFIRWKYKQLEKLSDYLKRVNDGDYILELQDNEEGELSILKSEIYKVTLTLREQNEQLKKEKAYLSDSLSDISHQLKTPLTSMFVMIDLLCDNQLKKSDRIIFTGRIRAQLERLQWLVQSLLKLSKLDAKTVVFKRQTILINELIEKACAPLLIPLEIKNQTFVVHADNTPFICDFNWTVEALVNVLKNCIEHTPSGGEIQILSESNPLYTEITVRDSGSGINPLDLPYIFNRFYKGRNASEDSVGIGLAMARTIVESQGGGLEARNADTNGGAVFKFRFPKN
jgi:signal transduction histidine kinase